MPRLFRRGRNRLGRLSGHRADRRAINFRFAATAETL